MGCFNLRAVCGVCNKEIGLNKFRVSKSKAWICPECFKKADTNSKINLRKLTIEEIKDIISEIETKEEIRKEIKIKSQLLTSEEMYKYCVDNNWASGWGKKLLVKHFKVLEDNLLEDEEVKMTFMGSSNYKSPNKNEGIFAVAITNKRIIMGRKKQFLGEAFNSVYLNNINSITFSDSELIGMLNIDTIKDTIAIRLNREAAKLVNNRIHEIFEEVREGKKPIKEEKFKGISVADEIRKFKELLDMGALTQEEFNAKKKQLLNL